MHIEVDHRWRVKASCDLILPMRATAAWGQLRDWMRFACVDPLHARIRILSPPRPGGGRTPQGTAIAIEHRLFGIGPDRIGRMLLWCEGQGFAFSDLSKRGVDVGFPHICTYALQPINESTCRLIIGARGRWTAPWWPRWLVRIWLGWVLRETRGCIRRDLIQFRAWRDRSS